MKIITNTEEIVEMDILDSEKNRMILYNFLLEK